jgi:hypothetical protein
MNATEKITQERIRRAQDLSNARALMHGCAPNLLRVAERSLIVLCYANWEGFFNFCVETLIEEVNRLKVDLRREYPSLLAGSINPFVQSYIDRGAEVQHLPVLAKNVALAVEQTHVDRSSIKFFQAASNLDFDRITVCFESLGLNISLISHHKSFINRELVGWRHSVAHGSEPNLDKADLVKHSNTTADLLLMLSNAFDDRIISLHSQASPDAHDGWGS